MEIEKAQKLSKHCTRIAILVLAAILITNLIFQLHLISKTAEAFTLLTLNVVLFIFVGLGTYTNRCKSCTKAKLTKLDNGYCRKCKLRSAQ